MKKAIVLAGGNGTRLYPLTISTNKHLLPLGGKPMIYWPLEFLAIHGFDEILVVVGQKGCGEIMRQVGSGNGLDLRGASVYYAFQNGETGIAAALKLAEPFVRGSGRCFPVMLGDNIFNLTWNDWWLFFDTYHREGATVFLYPTPYPEQFGCAVSFDRDTKKVSALIEKPRPGQVVTDLAVTGLYVYNEEVFRWLDQIAPSARNELEITDLNNLYARQGRLFGMDVEGPWYDAGTPELYAAANDALTVRSHR